MDKNLLVLSLGRVLQIVILFLASRIMTTLLSHEEVGFFYLLQSLVSYIGLVIMNPIGVFLTRRLNGWVNHKVSIRNFLLFSLAVFLLSLLSFPMIYIAKYYVGLNGNSWLSLAFLMSFFIFSSTVNNTLIPSLNILNYRISFVVFTFLTQASCLICSYLLVSNQGSAFQWILGQGIGFIFWFICAFLYYLKLGSEKDVFVKGISIERKSINTLLKFSFPIALTNISFWILSQSYRPVIENLIGLEFLGYIGLGFGLATSLSVSFEYLLQQFYYPNFYKRIENGDQLTREVAWNELFEKMLPLVLCMTTFIGFSAPYIIKILAAEKFWDAWIFICFGMSIEFFRITNNLISLISHSEMKTKKAVFPYFLGGITSLILILISAKSTNYQLYIPLSIIIGNILVFILLNINMRKLIRIKYPFKRILLSLIISFPFVLEFLLKNQYTSIISTLVILSIFSLYFIFAQLFLFKIGEKVNYVQ